MMVYYPNVDPAYIYKRKGDSTDPFIPLQESLVVDNGRVTLNEIPDFPHKVQIKKADGTPLSEVTSDVSNANQFKVDYSTGLVTLDESLDGATLTINYYGTGYVSFPASRIKVDTSIDNIENQSIQDLVRDMKNSRTNWLIAVDSYDEIATTYPNPKVGDTVQTMGDGKIYRFTGDTWINNQAYSDTALTSIQLRIDNLEKTPNEYEWTANAGQLTYVMPENTTYNPNTKWLEVNVGGAQISPSQIQKDNSNQFTLLVDPSYIPEGVKVIARWVEPYIPAIAGHKNTHEVGGYDEIDVTKLKNYDEQIANNFNEHAAQLADIAKVKFHFLPVRPIALTSLASGDCSLIVTSAGKTIMIDTGATESYDLIKDYLNKNGVTKIDYFIVSHYHPDHVDNLQSLINDFDFSKTIAYLQKDSTFVSGYFSAHERYVTVNNLLASNTKIQPNNGDTVTIDDVTIKFFNCSQEDIDYYNANSTDYNNQSLCCEVTHKNTIALYTGDINITAQLRMFQLGYFGKTDLLKVQHHGWDKDVNSDYIQSVHPDYSVTSISISAFISTGQAGDYSNDTYNGGMKSTTLSYLSSIGCKNYILGYTGGISFTSDGYKIVPDTVVKSQRHAQFSNTHPLFVYVDKNVPATVVSDGTLARPFRKIQEAITFVGDIPNQRIRIQIADGDYGEDVYLTGLFGIELAGNDNSQTAVKINSLTITDSLYFIQNINITGTKNVVLSTTNSIGQIDNSVIDGIPVNPPTFMDGRGVCAYNSILYLNKVTVSNRTVAVGSFNGSNVSLNNLKGSNNDYIVLAQNGDVNSIYFSGSFNKAFLVKKNGAYSGDYTKGDTASRLKSVDSNTTGIFHFFDTDLKRLITWDGSKWLDNAVTVSDWISVTFENGATQWSSNPCRFRKITEGGKNWVELEISIQTIAVNTTAFTLPVGYRPPSFTRHLCTTTGGAVAILEIATDGTVKMTSPNNTFPWDNTKYAIGKFRYALD